VRRVVFRVLFGAVLAVVFALSGWASFQRSVLGRSILVPNLTGKGVEEAQKIVRDSGLSLLVEKGRERFDERVPAHAILLQRPGVGSFVKPGQTVRVALSLGPRSILVPDLVGLSSRAAARSLTRVSLRLGEVSIDREPQPQGISAQYPPPETAASEAAPVAVLVNRSAAERLFVMPDLIGRDAEHEKERLTRFGFKVGATRYEVYDGLPANTILKQYPPAGYPCSPQDPITFTAAGTEAF
jgi:eukaryotic-like serine/threonine-protein kinase